MYGHQSFRDLPLLTEPTNVKFAYLVCWDCIHFYTVPCLCVSDTLFQSMPASSQPFQEWKNYVNILPLNAKITYVVSCSVSCVQLSPAHQLGLGSFYLNFM